MSGFSIAKTVVHVLEMLLVCCPANSSAISRPVISSLLSTPPSCCEHTVVSAVVVHTDRSAQCQLSSSVTQKFVHAVLVLIAVRSSSYRSSSVYVGEQCEHSSALVTYVARASA
eukprot:11672-Heterococcus_DN1.PRE.1